MAEHDPRAAFRLSDREKEANMEKMRARFAAALPPPTSRAKPPSRVGWAITVLLLLAAWALGRLR